MQLRLDRQHRKMLGGKSIIPENSIAFNDEYEHAREAHFANKQTAKDKVYQDQQKKITVLLAEIRLDRTRARRFAASGPLKHRLYEGIKKKYRNRLAAIRADADAERQRIDRTWPRLDWTTWVRQQAEAGREEAIKVMRSRAYALAKKRGNAITSQTEAMTKIADAIGIDNVTANGTIIYRIGTEAVRDDRESGNLDKGFEVRRKVPHPPVTRRGTRPTLSSCVFARQDAWCGCKRDRLGRVPYGPIVVL